MGLKHLESDCDGEEGRDLQQIALGFGRSSSYLQSTNRNPNQQLRFSAESSQCCSLARELGKVQVCLIWVLQKSPQLWSLICHHPDREAESDSLVIRYSS